MHGTMAADSRLTTKRSFFTRAGVVTLPAERAFGSIISFTEATRIERMAVALAEEKAPPWAKEYLEKAAPLFGKACAGAEVVLPVVIMYGKQAYAYYLKIPQNVMQGLWGLATCFYGGRFAVTIAAIEAFQATGGQQVMSCVQDLKVQFHHIQDANAADETIDEDNNGVSDVDELNPKELARRKVALFMRTADPEVIMRALGGVWTGYMGVLATLKFKFARAVALSHSIGDAVRPTVAKLLGPSLLSITPLEYRQWVSPSINFLCKFVAGFIAWRVQRFISTFQTGVTGGLLAATAALALLRDAKYWTGSDDETYADEVVGYSLAACGVYYQVVKNAPVPLLVRPVFIPFSILEWWLQFSTTWLASDSPKAK